MNTKSSKIQSPDLVLDVLFVGIRPSGVDTSLRELRRAKFEVSSRYVDSLEHLEAALQDGNYDIVLSDHTQTDLRPEEVLSTIKETEIDIPCIILAPEVDVETAVSLMRQGAGDCIPKSEIARLAPAVAREIRESKARRDTAPLRDTSSVGDFQTSITAPVEDTSRETESNSSDTPSPSTRRAEFLSTPPHTVTQSSYISAENAESQEVSAPREVTDVLTALVRAIGAKTDPAAIVHELSLHLKPLLPFSAVGISLLALDESEASAKKFARTQTDDAARKAGATSGNGRVAGASGNGATPDGFVQNGGKESNALWAATEIEPQNSGSELSWALEVALEAHGRSLGALHFATSRGAFSPDHEQLARGVASHLALAILQAQQLRQAQQCEEKYRLLFSNLDVIIWEVDPASLRFTFVNTRARQWLGYAAERWTEDENFWQTLVHPDDRERVLDNLRCAAKDGGDGQLEFRAVAADGSVLDLKNLINVDFKNGVALRIDGIMIDVTEQKRSEAALLQSNAILKATQEAAADGIFLVDDHGVVMSYNQRFIEMWRVPRDMVESLQEKQQLMAFVLSNLKDPEEFIEKLNFTFENPYARSHDEIYLNDGRVFSRHAAPALSPEGQSYGWVWSFSDITEHKRYELELARQASHDSLTGLPNRVLFMERLKRAISRSGGHGKQVMTALLFLDLDRFKVINDSLGHEHGDRMLIELAQRLRACIRPGDTAARFGGDEFTILLEEISSVNEATRVAERIEDYLQTPFSLGGHEIFTSASIGIVISTGTEERADLLLRHADVAMYRAKSRGGAQYEIFDSQMNSHALDRLQLEIDLRQALRREQLRVFYQPQVQARNGQITGFEALLRWEHPLRGTISPTEFIPIAEETGMILSIGLWVLREACTQARQWQLEMQTDPPLEISVNLSAKQFGQPGLVEDVARVLKETRLAPQSLMLEITESVVMEDEAQTIVQLENLKKLGVQLAIDDFGTGYSSLAYLERFALNTLKIDRAFVTRIGERGENTAIVRAVSNLGQALGVQVTAEGVETESQLTQLRALGCHTGQGYYFAKPLPVDEATALLKENPTW